MAPSFRKRVKIVPERKIGSYLAPGYEQYLPDDMQTGLADTDAIINDFLIFRNFVERSSWPDLENAHSASDVMSMASSNSRYGSHDTHLPHYFEDLSASPWSCSSGNSSFHGSSGGLSNGDHSHSHESMSRQSDLSGEEASIHCDISDEEMMDAEDMKQPARPSSAAGRLFPHLTGK